MNTVVVITIAVQVDWLLPAYEHKRITAKHHARPEAFPRSIQESQSHLDEYRARH